MSLLKQPGAAFQVTIQSFAPEPYELRRDLHVLVRPDGDSFVASFVDANVSASGDTPEDAVANLKDLIVLLLVRLSQEPPNKLGKGPARQLAVLKEFLRPH